MRDTVGSDRPQLTAAKSDRIETSRNEPSVTHTGGDLIERMEMQCPTAGRSVEASSDIDVERHSCSTTDQQARLAAMKEQLASIAAQPRVLWLPTGGAETLAPAETGLVPAQMQLVPEEADLVPAEADRGSAEADRGSAEEQLVPAQMQLVPAEAVQGSAEEQLASAQMQLVPAEADMVPAEADRGSAEEQLVPTRMQLVSAEADLVPAEAPLVSARARPADTARKRTPSAGTEDPGPVLPSEREAGATAVCAEATRPVESAEATSPQSRAGMPVAVGEEPREPQSAAPSPPRTRCNMAGGDSWRGQLSRRNTGLIKEFRGLPPAARLDLVKERGLCSQCLSCCDPKSERMHKRCRLKSWIENELCQRQHKCSQTHHRLLHVDAEGEKSPQTARPHKPAEPPDRLGWSPAHGRAKASRHVSTGTQEVAATQRKSRKRGSVADSGRRAATPVAICASLRVMPVATVARETAQPAEASEGEATRRRSSSGRPQQQQRAAGKLRMAAGRCKRKQIAQVANAAHEEHPANGYELHRACPELCVNIEDIRERLSWALNGNSAEGIKSHRKALLSEVERIEGAAAREARTRGWDLKEIEDLTRRMLAEAQCMLREADSTLCEQKAAHHAARVEDLAGEASEAGGTECWSRQDCTVFRKELEWELQAFRRANTKLELLVSPTRDN
jgi:hypothetical protein